MKTVLIPGPLFLIALLLFTACRQQNTVTELSETEVAVAWADMALYITRHTPENSPTYASRCLGYTGLAMYESIVADFPLHNSIASHLNGLGMLPKPEDGPFNPVLSLNSAQAHIIKALYRQTSELNKSKIDSLEDHIRRSFSMVPDDVAERSSTYGRVIAEQIFQWSLNDGGHRGYLANFDKKLEITAHPGSWEPPLYGQAISHYPLHPHWGKNRTFLRRNSEMKVPDIIPFDADTSSEYGQQFIEVYAKSKSLTQEEKEIALWWGDDPGETFTPPGHSYNLGTLALKKTNADLITCAETYARVGLAVADAFINCWKWKYHHFSERPSSYIAKNVDDKWESFWPDPPFPAFPSGHAIQSAATAIVLTDMFGENFEFVDDSHINRAQDEIRKVGFNPRRFTSFWQVAEETAYSRFVGGIHTRQDNDAGLREGRTIGFHVNALPWRASAMEDLAAH